MIVNVSIVIAVAAFVVLVIYLISAIQTAKSTLKQIEGTLQDLKHQTIRLSEQSEKLLVSVQEVTDDARKKIQSVNGIFTSVRHFGEAVTQVTAAFKEASAAISRSVRPNPPDTHRPKESTVGDTLRWLQQTYELWNLWTGNKKNR